MAPSPRNPAFRDIVTESFARQGLMRTLGAEIAEVEPGRCTITAPIRPETAQQHGFAHAGTTFAIGDSACGYAALSLQEERVEVLTSEMKIHLLAPATGERLVARGEVLRAGHRLVVARADIFAETGEDSRHVATLLGTIVPVPAP